MEITGENTHHLQEINFKIHMVMTVMLGEFIIIVPLPGVEMV
jgi:hypothetical protein